MWKLYNVNNRYNNNPYNNQLFLKPKNDKENKKPAAETSQIKIIICYYIFIQTLDYL